MKNKKVIDVYIVDNWKQKAVAILGWVMSHSLIKYALTK